jgi:hypothetical protein
LIKRFAKSFYRKTALQAVYLCEKQFCRRRVDKNDLQNRFTVKRLCKPFIYVRNNFEDRRVDKTI